MHSIRLSWRIDSIEERILHAAQKPPTTLHIRKLIDKRDERCRSIISVDEAREKWVESAHCAATVANDRIIGCKGRSSRSRCEITVYIVPLNPETENGKDGKLETVNLCRFQLFTHSKSQKFKNSKKCNRVKGGWKLFEISEDIFSVDNNIRSSTNANQVFPFRACAYVVRIKVKWVTPVRTVRTQVF